VRADVEESYIERIRKGDAMTVRLPSGTELKGTVIYIGSTPPRDAARRQAAPSATSDVRGAAESGQQGPAPRRGMTAYVLMPAQ